MFQRHIGLIAAVLASIVFAGSAYGQSVNVNFQPAGSETPEGYLADTGVVFADQGNGFSYGWDSDITANTRDRGADDDQRYDTLNHVQKAEPPAVWDNRPGKRYLRDPSCLWRSEQYRSDQHDGRRRHHPGRSGWPGQLR